MRPLALALAASSLVPAAPARAELVASRSVAGPERVVSGRASSWSRLPSCRPPARWLSVGGRCGWRVSVRFSLPSRVQAATLRLRPLAGALEGVMVHAAAGRRLGVVRRAAALDVTRALAGRRLTLVLRGPPRRELRFARPPTLTVHVAPRHRAGAFGSVWVTPAELAALPTSGPAWRQLRRAADRLPGTANLADQESNHDIDALAAALVYARTGDPAYRAAAARAVLAAIGTERGGRTLALGRNLAAYVIAADLAGLASFDRAGDRRFRAWLDAVRTEPLSGKTLISTHDVRPNNWGTMAGASRVAADLYLGDGADLDRAARIFAGWLGDRGAYAGFRYKDLSWQADPLRPVGINPVGAVRDGVDVDGALPDDMRRGCPLRPVPCPTVYAWEALQGVIVQADLLSRHGYPAWSWGDRAILRAAQFLERLDARFGGWWATGDDSWQPFVINHAYGTALRATAPARPGKILGWTDWVYGPNLG